MLQTALPDEKSINVRALPLVYHPKRLNSFLVSRGMSHRGMIAKQGIFL